MKQDPSQISGGVRTSFEILDTVVSEVETLPILDWRRKSMNKRIVVSFLATLLFVSLHFVEAQQPKKVPRIGVLAVLSIV